MKLYPILSNGSNLWHNWTNTLLREMNSKIFSLFQYINYFNPDFYEYNLTVTSVNSNKNVNIAELPLHGYYRISETLTDITTGKTLEPGTLIVAYGRGEGEIDDKTAVLRQLEKSYTIQPFGWASYYTASFDNQSLNFLYNQRAQESYGLNYAFVFDTVTKRYYIKAASIIEVLSNINENTKSISFLAHSGSLNLSDSTHRQWYIVYQNQNNPISSIWTNTTTNPLMYGFFYENNIQSAWHCEEIIFDTTWETSSKIAETNIAVYTINKKESSTWPDSSLWVEAI